MKVGMSIEQMQYYMAKLAYETDSWDVAQMLAEGSTYVIVDGRTEAAYSQEHIPQAINVPHRDISQTTTAHLDKSKIYICYCDGIGCNASTKTAMKLLSLGFEVRELLGGLDWWKRDGYATAG
jgi:rhodanese-related sulfurtransferase